MPNNSGTTGEFTVLVKLKLNLLKLRKRHQYCLQLARDLTARHANTKQMTTIHLGDITLSIVKIPCTNVHSVIIQAFRAQLIE